MKKRYIILLALALVLLSGCAKKEENTSRSIEQIHSEDGTPVVIKAVKQEGFSKYLTYYGRLTGYKQSTETSMLSGKIEQINYKEGVYVEENDVILSFPQDLAGANFQAAKANYDVNKKTYDRLNELYKAGGISQQELDQVKAGYLAAESQLDAVSKMLQVRAPISGYLTSIYVRESDMVSPGDLLFTVSDRTKLKSVINVTEKEIDYFQTGMPARANWENLIYYGKVKSVGYALNERTGVFEVELEFDNPENYMKFNINASIEVEVYNNPEAFVLEHKYLLRDSGGSYVFLAEGNKARKQYVELGNYSGTRFEAVSGIKKGDLLVVEGMELLEEGNLLKMD